MYCLFTKGGIRVIFKKVHGIQLWKLNMRFKKLGYSKSWAEDNNNGMINLYLDPVETDQYSSAEVIAEINEIINELEGVETFRLCVFRDCKITYAEQLSHHTLSRWIEISFVSAKQKLIS
jgi:hypothetical protein